MPLSPLEHDRRYGELDQVIRAYAGQSADDTPEKPSDALVAYLRHTWHSRPGPSPSRSGSCGSTPTVRRADSACGSASSTRSRTSGSRGEIQQWLYCLADHLKHSVEEGEVPPPATPATHWEWHARFPELGQFLGGWFSQDMPDEFDDHDAATDDYRTATDPHLVARLTGELHELLALDLDESDYALAVAELGMEIDPPTPYSPSGWLALVADRLTAPRADYGNPADQS